MKLSKYNEYVDFGDEVIIFNMTSRALILISKDEFDIIRSNPKSSFINEKTTEKLRNNNILVNKSLNEEDVLLYNINRWKHNQKVLSLFISFTSQCNLQCSYCYQDSSNKKNTFLSLDNWKIIFSHIKRKLTAQDIREVSIVLFGGEPTLNMDILIQAVNDVHSLRTKRTSVNMALITNGTLINNDKLLSVINNINMIQITLDGVKDIHDKRRVYRNGLGTFDIIMNNLKLLRDNYTNDVLIRCNADKENFESIKLLFDYLRQESLFDLITGVDIGHVYSSQENIKMNKCETLLSKEGDERIKELFDYAVKKGYRISRNYVNGPCMGLAINGYAIDENLNIYSCPGFLYEEPEGMIDHTGGIEIIHNRWFDIINEVPRQCLANCKYVPICYGGCKWMAKEGERKCNKEFYDRHLKDYLKLYVNANYANEIEKESLC
ncbi:MAG TPA: radical SAM protein [Ignavibacteria bacterium]|nr:radical SAM protein [Ignavibacteria bacterium]